ncbi:MAG TPA: UvrD-helicase domain-containing protein [Pirellulales bacterium]|jgi:DNA helicase-2/ATP-dependent DNA helicase PcrA|nr:UvrD-helicase domain-containing protein [Pirellulales bacterium]
MDDLLDSLTPAQRSAVEHIDGPLLILAGPGSGKTRVVTHRIANLLRHGVGARQILALTFTNKAADEMKGRVERLAPGQSVWVGTFHRFCARLLRQYASLVGLQENYTIYDTGDSAAVLRRAREEADVDSKHFTPPQMASAISWAKNNLIGPEEYQPRVGQPLGAVVAKIYPVYQRRLLTSNAVDFDDLLLHVATLLRANPELRETLDTRYRYILVDEYQDTNLAQYAIVRALSITYPNLAVTGDPDQSIYGWRGANINNILNFEHDFPSVHVVRLEQNYRSTKRIVRVAAELISWNTKRKEKGLFTENPEGRPVRYASYPTQMDEADHIVSQIAEAVHGGLRRPRDFAIFYRVNALSRPLEHALRSAGIPYQMINGVEFYQRKEIKDVLAYLMLVNNPRDDMAFLRAVNMPPRGIGKTTLDRLGAYATRYGKTLLDAAREAGVIDVIPKKAAVAVAKFVAMYDRLSLISMRPVEEILGHVLNETGYQAHLEDSGLEEDQDRLANIQELLTAAREFDEQTPGEGHLEEFLENVCLINDVDVWESSDDRVAMMTLHASKGLEFPCVYIVAVEEGLLPHERSQNSPDELEEERRLLFVGITRAEEELQLSVAQYREFRGRRQLTIPSKFLLELPFDEMDATEASDGGWDERAHHDDVEVQLHEDDVVWSPPDASEGKAGISEIGKLRVPTLMTAAQLSAPGQTDTGLSPELFHQGMLVLHPEYGLGKIIALSGSGLRRTATVSFASTGEKKFVLAQSPLQPVKSGDEPQ